VLFDLLSALLDSWSLWNDVAGGPEAGRTWRTALLERVRAEGAYRDYETLMTEAATSTGLPASRGADLVRRWDELRPWPGANAMLRGLRGKLKTAVVTNCSESLGRRAAALLEVSFDTVVTAERAGSYKPDKHPYVLALHELQVPASRALFVAGSPNDLLGGARAGLPVVWHNPLRLPIPRGLTEAGAAPPLAEIGSLAALSKLLPGEEA